MHDELTVLSVEELATVAGGRVDGQTLIIHVGPLPLVPEPDPCPYPWPGDRWDYAPVVTDLY